MPCALPEMRLIRVNAYATIVEKRIAELNQL
jgi:hypothetical protein